VTGDKRAIFLCSLLGEERGEETKVRKNFLLGLPSMQSTQEPDESMA